MPFFVLCTDYWFISKGISINSLGRIVIITISKLCENDNAGDIQVYQ